MLLGQQVVNTLMECAKTISASYNISLRKVGSKAVGNSKFFERIGKQGKSATYGTVDEALCWFSHYWPAYAVWPEFGVKRPRRADRDPIIATLPDGRFLLERPVSKTNVPTRSKSAMSKASKKSARARAKMKSARIAAESKAMMAAATPEVSTPVWGTE